MGGILSRNGKNNADGSFNWEDAIADAAIMGGSSFFGTLVGLGAAGLLNDVPRGLLAAAIAAGASFFAVLAAKRGLREKQ